jgi:hypothetical protein
MLKVVEIEVVRVSAARVFGELDTPVLALSAWAKVLCLYLRSSTSSITTTPEQRPSRTVIHQHHYGFQAMKGMLPHY